MILLIVTQDRCKRSSQSIASISKMIFPLITAIYLTMASCFSFLIFFFSLRSFHLLSWSFTITFFRADHSPSNINKCLLQWHDNIGRVDLMLGLPQPNKYLNECTSIWVEYLRVRRVYFKIYLSTFHYLWFVLKTVIYHSNVTSIKFITARSLEKECQVLYRKYL